MFFVLFTEVNRFFPARTKINPVSTPPVYFSKEGFRIILKSTLRSSKWSFRSYFQRKLCSFLIVLLFAARFFHFIIFILINLMTM
jgi:hypothetical protein